MAAAQAEQTGRPGAGRTLRPSSSPPERDRWRPLVDDALARLGRPLDWQESGKQLGRIASFSLLTKQSSRVDWPRLTGQLEASWRRPKRRCFCRRRRRRRHLLPPGFASPSALVWVVVGRRRGRRCCCCCFWCCCCCCAVAMILEPGENAPGLAKCLPTIMMAHRCCCFSAARASARPKEFNRPDAHERRRRRRRRRMRAGRALIPCSDCASLQADGRTDLRARRH